MKLTPETRSEIFRELAERLGGEREVRKVVVFGSFLNHTDPHDLDVAVFQDSNESYLPLALKYRRLTRDIARRIPMDILPVRHGVPGGYFVQEILRGQVVYERRVGGAHAFSIEGKHGRI